MKRNQQRLVDHVTLKVKNLEKSKEFYRAVAETLGYTISYDEKDHFVIDGLKIVQNAEPSHSVQLAFHAQNPACVKLFHEAALNCGGRCLTPPQTVSMDQFQARVLDPDGNNVEVLFRTQSPYSLRESSY